MLIVAGALLLLDAGVTVVWQEPLSAIYAAIEQDDLAADLATLERSELTEAELAALTGLRGDRRRIAFLARSLRRRARDGDALGRIEIPRIGASFVVVQGTKADDLRRGPGHYASTAFPGLPGNAVLA